MITFIDTSGIYAVLDRDDQNHKNAERCWTELLDKGEPLLTTNYVLLELCALTQHRLGMEAVRAIEEDIVPVLQIEWIDKEIHALAMSALLAAQRRKLSLVDCTSFLTMRRARSSTALAFDKHFLEEGFGFPLGAIPG